MSEVFTRAEAAYIVRERAKQSARIATLERQLAARGALALDLRARLKQTQTWITQARLECQAAQRQLTHGDNLRQGDSAAYQVAEAIVSLRHGMRAMRTRSRP